MFSLISKIPTLLTAGRMKHDQCKQKNLKAIEMDLERRKVLRGPRLPLHAFFKDTLRCILTLHFYSGAQGSDSVVAIVWAYLTSWFHLEPFSKRLQQDTEKHNMISAYTPLPEQEEIFLLLFCLLKFWSLPRRLLCICICVGTGVLLSHQV